MLVYQSDIVLEIELWGPGAHTLVTLIDFAELLPLELMSIYTSASHTQAACGPMCSPACALIELF